MKHRVTNGKPQLELNITDVITEIISEISSRSVIFKHIVVNKILVCIASNRRNSTNGTYGKVVPLKFKGGSNILRIKGKDYTIPGIVNNGYQVSYLIYFYIPKFFNLTSFEKLKVIFHELYHISPEFDGDIRRFGRGNSFHGYSKERFDSLFKEELAVFYDYIINTKYMKFLEMDVECFHISFDRIYGRRMKLPKPVIIKNP